MNEPTSLLSPKLVSIGKQLRREIPELLDPEDLLDHGLVYPLFGALAQQLHDWMASGREDLVARTFALINEWCALEDDEIDNMIQTGFFEDLADQEGLRPRTVELLSDRGRYLYAEIVEFIWGKPAVRALGLEPPGTWGK